MIKVKKVRCLLLFAVCVSLIIGYFPLKLAKNYSKYDLSSEEYIVCKETRVTGCNWTRILESKSNDLIYDIDNNMIVTEDFNFVDVTPLNSVYKLDSSNVYVVYGEQLSQPIENTFYENIRYTCEQWEILYPINRQSVIGALLPKNYLCTWDIIENLEGIWWFIFQILYFSFLAVYVCMLLYKLAKSFRIWGRIK